MRSIIILICFLSVRAVFGQKDTTVNFWAAVTPKAQPFDTSKVDNCLRLLRSLPPHPLETRPVIPFPSNQELQQAAHSAQAFEKWLRKAKIMRELGYKDYSNFILEALTRYYPSTDPSLRFDAYTEIIYSCLYNLEFGKADSICMHAIKMANSAGMTHAGLAWISAHTDHRLQRTEMAREKLAVSLALAQKEGSKHWELRNQSTMGVISRDVFFGHTLKAIPDHLRALDLAIETRDTFYIINELIALGFNYDDAAKMDLHLDYLYKALEYLKHYEVLYQRMRILSALCEILPDLGRTEEAISLREGSLRIAKLAKSSFTSDIYLRLSTSYISLHKWDKAKAALDSVETILKQNGRYDTELFTLEQQYYVLFKAKGDIPEALKHLERAYAGVSQNYVKRNAQLLSEYETQYRTGEKEKLLKTTQKQRSWLLLLAVLITMLCIVVFISYFRQRATARLVAQQKEIVQRQSEELRQLEQLKSRFFTNVSHELRTPLTLMLGPLNHLLKQDYWTDRDRKLLEITNQNGKRLLNLVNEILDLAKLETGRMEIRESAVNWYKTIEPTVAQFASFSDSHLAKLSFNFQADPDLNIYLDTNKFEKILHNFLSNALKFTPQGGTITLTASDLGDQLQVCVRDTGQGIHPSDLPHIFDRFYQSRRADSPVQGGTGIGLSLCYELSELLGGNIWAESVYGSGSSFYFEFPKKVVTEEAFAPQMGLNTQVIASSTPTALPTSSQSGTIKGNILVVEDNPELRQYIQVILEGYQVHTAVNGKEALDLLQSGVMEPPDLIISDIMMPVMDGVQFLNLVKRSDQFRHIPFVMLTARGDARIKLQALRIGVDDYMLKPFEADELLARIQNLLQNHFERLRLYQMLSTENPAESVMEETIPPVVSEVNARWLADLERLLEKKLDDHAFNFNWVASELNLSERQFRRKVQQLTGMPPNKYLQEMRLQQARSLMSSGKFSTIKEIGYAVGYRDTPYFSALFTERFGSAPSQLLR
ncbi:MAG TPA: ATP-binding protein [Saprospiraceae bacterium]|nr:ATP-binding protein [Saprospiraceae bacterium]